MYQPVATQLDAPKPNKHRGKGNSGRALSNSRTKTTPPKPKKRAKRTAAQNWAEAYKKRKREFKAAVRFAHHLGYPLLWLLTISWRGCEHGERREGHILHLPEPQRRKRVKDRISRLARRHGFEVCSSMRGPMVGATVCTYTSLSAGPPGR